MVVMEPHGHEIYKATKIQGTAQPPEAALTSARYYRTVLSGSLGVEIFEKDCHAYGL